MKNFNKHSLASALVLHAVVLICWVAYSFYQPVIFEDFGLQSLTESYLSIQNVMLVLTPIISGYITDRYLVSKGKVIINLMLGVMITACLFLSLSGIFLSKSESIHPIIPALMLVWVVSMNMFYNPGLSLLSQTARQSGWAYASAITGSVTDISFAIIGYLIIFFRSLGYIYTFASGAILVLLGAIYFYRSHKDHPIVSNTSLERKPIRAISLITSAFVGVGLGFVHYKILHHLPVELHGLNGKLIIPIIMVGCAIVLIKLHPILHHFGLLRLFCIGLIFCTASYGIINNVQSFTGSVIGLIILIPGILSVSGTAFGAALNNIPPSWCNLGTGIFLAGFNSMIYMI